jgi:hypothetical protein
MAPGTSFEAYPIPVLAEPKKIIRALDQLRSLKTFPSPDAVNTTTGPQLPKYVSHALGSLYQPWKPGYLRSAYCALQFGHFEKVTPGKIQDFSLGEIFCWSRNFVRCNDFRKWSHYMFRAAR